MSKTVTIHDYYCLSRITFLRGITLVVLTSLLWSLTSLPAWNTSHSIHGTYQKQLAVTTLSYLYQTVAGHVYWGDTLKEYRSPCWREPVLDPFNNRYWTFLYQGWAPLRVGMTSVMDRSRGMKSRLRCLPAVYLGGIYKGGTTDLYYWLSQHPLLYPSMLKEPLWHLWNTGKMAPVAFTDYIGLFDLAALEIENVTVNTVDGITHPGLAFDATAGLIHMYRYWQQLPWNRNATEPRLFIADHIKLINPNAKVIFMLREPVSWLESCYNYLHANYPRFSPEDLHSRVTTDLENFHQCSAAGGSLNACVYNHNSDNCSVLNSLYYVPVSNWMNTFDRKQILIRRSEDYYRDRNAVLGEIYEFLDVGQPRINDNDVTQIKNKSKYRISMLNETKRTVSQFMYKWNIKLSELLTDNSFLEWNLKHDL